MDKKTGNRPIKTVRDGALEVSIWKRETDNGAQFNTERSRSYLDKDGNWKRTSAIPERDLLRAARLDGVAYSKIQKLREQDRTKDNEKSEPRRDRRDRER